MRLSIPASTLTETSILYTEKHTWIDRHIDSSIPTKQLFHKGIKKKKKKKKCICETQMPQKRPFFKKCNHYI